MLRGPMDTIEVDLPFGPGDNAEADNDEDSRPALGWARILAYCLANIGFGMFYGFNNSTLTLWLQQFTKDPRPIGLLGGSHSFEGVVLQPLAGSISDRFRSPLGRRRPLMLVFVPISCVLLCVTPIAAHVHSHRLLWIAISIVVFTCAFNLAYDPYQALLADSTSPSQRGRVSAAWYLAGAVGQVGLLFLPMPLTAKFYLLAASMLAMTLVTAAATPERSTAGDPRPSSRKRDELAKALGGLNTLTQARLYLITFLFYGAGVDAITPNLTIFVKTITRCGDSAAQHSFMVLLLATALAMIPCGWAADRFGPKRLLIGGFLLIASASICGLWVTTLLQIRCVLAVAGVATAAQNAGAFPLLTRLAPAREIGFYTGLQAAVLSIAGPAAIWFTGDLIEHGGYRMIFAVCTVCTIIASTCLVPISVKRAREEVAAREAATA